ncbi:MAG: NAD(P)/FAD-dependent oxidoreductase, partial [Pirellulales bacterium]
MDPATDTASDFYPVVVAGAGAAGLLAAARSADRGRQTFVLVNNRKPGGKILICGRTRCKLKHNTDAAG